MKLVFEYNIDKTTKQFYLLKDNHNVGFIQIRKMPTKSSSMPTGFESNIYYEIDGNFRNKGYGKNILFLGIKESKSLGLDNLIITASIENISSIKIIESNNGKLLGSKPNKAGVIFNKYIIKIK